MDRPKRWTVAVDVDGVLHSYFSGWQGAAVLPDPPVPGAIEWLEAITEEYDVSIFSTRCESDEGCEAIKDWLKNHGISSRALSCIEITPKKRPALIYIDDRGWRFTGNNFPSIQDIQNALPWWKNGQ